MLRLSEPPVRYGHARVKIINSFHTKRGCILNDTNQMLIVTA